MQRTLWFLAAVAGAAVGCGGNVSDGANDITWTAGDTGTFTLFPNRPFGDGTATLTSTSPFIGPTTIPIAQNRFTIVVIR